MITDSSMPFNHNRPGEDYAGHRGVIFEATTGFSSGRVFSTRFPDVYISDSGDVEFVEYRVPAEQMLEWLEAAAAAIRARA